MEPAPDFEGVEKRCFKGKQQISTFSVSMDKKVGISTISKIQNYGGAIHLPRF